MRIFSHQHHCTLPYTWVKITVYFFMVLVTEQLLLSHVYYKKKLLKKKSIIFCIRYQKKSSQAEHIDAWDVHTYNPFFIFSLQPNQLCFNNYTSILLPLNYFLSDGNAQIAQTTTKKKSQVSRGNIRMIALRKKRLNAKYSKIEFER